MSGKVTLISEFHHDGRNRRVFMVSKRMSQFLERLLFEIEAGNMTDEDIDYIEHGYAIHFTGLQRTPEISPTAGCEQER